MSSNPFLNAINFQPPTQGAQSFDRQSYINNMLSNMHGVDMSQLPQNTWQPDDSFINAMSNFSKSGTSGAPSIPGALSNAQAPQGSGSSSGLSFIDRLKNAAGDAWNQTIGKEYSQAKGGLEGLLTGLLSGVNVHAGQAQAPKNVLDPLTGFYNPQQEAQKYQGMKGDMGPGVLPWVAKVGADTVTEPLTYAPVGPALKVLGKATGAVKAMDALKQSAPDAVRAPLNALTSLFKPIAGARQPFLNAVSRMTGKTQSGINEIMNNLQTIFKGTTPAQRIALTHALESTAPGTTLSDPTLEALRQQVEPLLQQATQHSVDRGLISNTINPADYGVGRYIPHVNVGKLAEEDVPFSDIGKRNPNIDAGKSRNLEGTIQAINSASGSPVFEEDLAKILGYHLGQINKASNIRDLIDEAMQHGLPADGAVKAGQQFPSTLQRAIEYASPHTGESVLLPESEARYLQSLRAPQSEMSQTFKNGYRKSVNALNQLMFTTSPFIHILNNLGTQTALHDPGVFLKMPKYMKEAWKGVQPGSQMDDALKNGALHLSSIMHSVSSPKNLANQVAKSIDSTDGPLSRLKSAGKAYMQLTPKMEQAYRAAAYDRALEKGMTPDEASNWIRSIYGGRIAGDAASPAENATAAFMPFINWTKTAIGSNVKNALNNPAPYVAGFNALNDYNQQMTGHGMDQNPNPLSIPLPWKDAQGNQEYMAPYAPPFDVAKLGKEVADNGLRGLASFAYSRTNPLVKYAGQLASGEQNLFANPLEKFNVMPYPALPSSFNKRGIFFGDKGPQVPAYLGQFLQDISNPLSVVDDFQNKGLRDSLLTQLLGGTITASNPASQQKQQKWQQGEVQRELKSYSKKHTGGQ